MASWYTDLLDTLNGLPPRPPDLKAFITAAPPVAGLPSPYATWPLLALLRYLRRKLWAWDVVGQRLQAHLPRPERTWVTANDILHSARDGIVPGLPDWRYHLDGNDSYLAHRGTAERIHLDLLNGPQDVHLRHFIDFYLNHREPGPAERRLARPFRRGDRTA